MIWGWGLVNSGELDIRRGILVLVVRGCEFMGISSKVVSSLFRIREMRVV